MTKKTALLISIFTLLTLFFHPTTKAYSDEYNLSSQMPGTTIDVRGGDSVRIYDSVNDSPKITFIHIIGDAEVTLDNVTVDNSILSNELPVIHIDSGVNARIILKGTSLLQGDVFYPAISVAQNASVTISGDGTLQAVGGVFAAGIGGENAGISGNIYIEDKAVVNAQGGLYGAGIGSGLSSNENSFIVSIKDEAKVTAIGGGNSAGIGTGANCSGGTAVINISGDSTVHAIGGNFASGIGSGTAQSSLFKISMSGGRVYAEGKDSYKDISDITESSISGGTALFLASNSIDAGLSAPDGHTNHFPLSFSGNTVYGVTVDPSWTTATGGYFRLSTLTYSLNGGTGSAPAPVTQHYGTTAALDSGSGISLSGYAFSGWNTQANGSGTIYSAGGSYTFDSDTTLYAKWAYVPTATPTPVPTAKPTATPYKSYATSTPSPTATPEAKAVPTDAQSASPAPTSAPSPTPAPTAVPTPLPSAILTAQVSSNGGTSTAMIDVSSLPEGTKAVKLPNGKTVSLENAVDGKLIFEVEESWVFGGVVEIIAIGDEEILLGYYSIDIPVEESLKKSFPVWLMIVGGAFLLFWIVFAFARIFRVKTNPRYTRK